MKFRLFAPALAFCASFLIAGPVVRGWDIKVSKGARTLQTVTTADDGSFEAKGLPPGDYTLCVSNAPGARGLAFDDAPAQSSVVKSKSNITNNRADPAARTINTSRSNIKNLVRTPNGDACTDATVGADGILRGRAVAEAVEARPAQAVK
jgi:hypothetical protein